MTGGGEGCNPGNYVSACRGPRGREEKAFVEGGIREGKRRGCPRNCRLSFRKKKDARWFNRGSLKLKREGRIEF